MMNHEGLVTLTLTLDWVLHTILHHSSASTYMPNFIKIEETLWTDERTYARTDGRTFETGFIKVDSVEELTKKSTLS